MAKAISYLPLPAEYNIQTKLVYYTKYHPLGQFQCRLMNATPKKEKELIISNQSYLYHSGMTYWCYFLPLKCYQRRQSGRGLFNQKKYEPGTRMFVDGNDNHDDMLWDDGQVGKELIPGEK
eukprot:429398-Ditylum_brightwellii.AAC.1